MAKTSKPTPVVFGFDLGDGEFAVYYVLPSKSKEPISAFTKETQLSGYGITDDGQIIFGDALYNISYANLKHLETLRTNFKSTPGSGNDAIIKKFAQTIYETVRKENPQYFGKEYAPMWFIGCPSEWQHKDSTLKSRYAKIFKGAGLENVRICDESTAALAYYDAALTAVSLRAIEAGVLLLDYGSSTLDATFIMPNGNNTTIKPYGCALGAAFVEKALLYLVLYASDQYDSQEEYNDKALLERVRNQCEKDKVFKTWLLLKMRQLKELYFNSRSQGGFMQEIYTENHKLPPEIDWGMKRANITLVISEGMMNKVLNTPIKDVVPDFNSLSEFTKNDIGNDSWMGRNNRFLEYVSKQHKHYANKEDALLVLTGGASKMDCVRASVSLYFPSCKTSFDTNPSTTIGRGLAYWGPSLIKAEAFDKAFDEILDMPHKDEKGNIVYDDKGEETSEILNIICDSYGLLMQDVIDEIALKEATSIQEAIVAWMEGDIQCNKISAVAVGKFEKWMKDEMQKIYKKGASSCVQNTKVKVNGLFKDLYTKNGLYIEIFSGKEMEMDLVEVCKNLLSNQVKGEIVKEINSLDPIFCEWGNGLKFWRKQKIDEDVVIEMLKQINSETRNWLVDVFSSDDFVEALIIDNFSAIKAELDSKKESTLYKLGLVL